MTARERNTLFQITDALPDEYYFVTGSKAWGYSTADSDIDICVLVGPDYEELLEELEAESIVGSRYNNGIKAQLNGIEINIIPLHPVDFVAWGFATKIIKSVGFNNSLVNKDKRVYVFETYVNVTKLFLTYIDRKDLKRYKHMWGEE